MIKDINNLSGLDKAGLLFQILGESLALTLFIITLFLNFWAMIVIKKQKKQYE